MAAELTPRPGGRTALLAASPECAKYTSDPTLFVSRQLASDTRAEYSIDMALSAPGRATEPDRDELRRSMNGQTTTYRLK